MKLFPHKVDWLIDWCLTPTLQWWNEISLWYVDLLKCPRIYRIRSLGTSFTFKHNCTRKRNENAVVFGMKHYCNIIWFDFFVFNVTFSNISAISWQPFKWWKKLEYPERTTDHGQAIFCNLQSWAQTHAVFVIGLYELLGNPTITHWATPALITI